MIELYQCPVCRKLYRQKDHCSKCCKAGYKIQRFESTEGIHVLKELAEALIIQSFVETVSDTSQSYDTPNSDFTGDGGSFGGAGASGSWDSDLSSSDSESSSSSDE